MPRRVVKYDVRSVVSIQSLIELGWELYGGPFSTGSGYWQAVVKYEDVPEEPYEFTLVKAEGSEDFADAINEALSRGWRRDGQAYGLFFPENTSSVWHYQPMIRKISDKPKDENLGSGKGRLIDVDSE